MAGGGIEVVDGAAVGTWIEPELNGEVGSVTGSVPDRFAAYVRILHPASGSENLAEEILSKPEFEAFPVSPSDSLTWDADRVNPQLRGMEDT